MDVLAAAAMKGEAMPHLPMKILGDPGGRRAPLAHPSFRLSALLACSATTIEWRPPRVLNSPVILIWRGSRSSTMSLAVLRLSRLTALMMATLCLSLKCRVFKLLLANSYEVINSNVFFFCLSTSLGSEVLNRLNKVKVKRIYTTSKHINPKTGKEVTRTQQQFDVFQIDFASLNEGLAAIGHKPLACRTVSLFFALVFS